VVPPHGSHGGRIVMDPVVVPLKWNTCWFPMAEPVLGYSNTFVIVIWHDLLLFPCITLCGPFIPGNVAIPIAFFFYLGLVVPCFPGASPWDAPNLVFKFPKYRL
jgi:hypothetical protein